MGTLKRLGQWVISRWDTLSTVAGWIWIVAGGLVTGWAAAAADLFPRFAPFSWVAAGLLGGLVAAGIAALFAFARERFAQADYVRAVTGTPSTVNPLRQNFEREKIDLRDFWSAIGTVRHYRDIVFRNCDFHGPGSLIFSHECRLYHNGFVYCDLVCVRHAPIFSAVMFERCAFHNCKFINITILLAENIIEPMIREMQGPTPIIIGYNEPPQPPLPPEAG